MGFIILTLTLSGCLKEETSAEVAPTETASSDESPPPVPPAKTPSNAENKAPTISGIPPTAVSAGYSYSFLPTADDAESDSLTFHIQNLPSWASFDITTGEIFGATTQDDVGTYSNIIVSVSDGVDTIELPAFSISVSHTAVGSMLISWTPPTEYTDGSLLNDLAGYRLYIGTSMGTYTNRIDLDSVGIASYVIENLEPSTYFVVATSYSSSGSESAFSNVVVKTVL
jgi:hypothetical protein